MENKYLAVNDFLGCFEKKYFNNASIHDICHAIRNRSIIEHKFDLFLEENLLAYDGHQENLTPLHIKLANKALQKRYLKNIVWKGMKQTDKVADFVAQFYLLDVNQAKLLLESSPDFWYGLPNETKFNRDIVDFMLDNNKSVFYKYIFPIVMVYNKKVCRHFEDYEETIEEAIKSYPENIKYVHTDILADKTIALAIISRDGLLLEFLDPSLKDDYNVVEVAVKQNGLAIEFASLRLKDDPRIVIAAYKQHYDSFFFSSLRIRKLCGDKEPTLPLEKDVIRYNLQDQLPANTDKKKIAKI